MWVRASAWLAQLWPGHDVTATLDDNEGIWDVVRRHRVVLVGPLVVAFVGLAVCLAPGWPDVTNLVGLAMLAWAAWQVALHHTDRFVITNHRVFRVRGVLHRSRASMPIRRVLDITVHKPLLGLLAGYGHFVFESAAQEQGLREIRYVGRPDERERTIQRLIHQGREHSASDEPRVTPGPEGGHCRGCRCDERFGSRGSPGPAESSGREPSGRDSAGQRSTGEGSASQGSAGQGSASQGSAGQGSAGQESWGQGSSGAGSTARDWSSQGRSNPGEDTQPYSWSTTGG